MNSLCCVAKGTRASLTRPSPTRNPFPLLLARGLATQSLSVWARCHLVRSGLTTPVSGERALLLIAQISRESLAPCLDRAPKRAIFEIYETQRTLGRKHRMERLAYYNANALEHCFSRSVWLSNLTWFCPSLGEYSIMQCLVLFPPSRAPKNRPRASVAKLRLLDDLNFYARPNEFTLVEASLSGWRENSARSGGFAQSPFSCNELSVATAGIWR